MNKKKNIIIVQARETSSRFPGKVLNLIGSKSICEIILLRLSRCKHADNLVFAIPFNKSNKKLQKHLKQINAEVYLGSEHDVLNRYYNAAKKYKATNIIRVTGDCPLIDPKLVDDMIKKFEIGNYDYINNAQFPNYSDGFDIEVFSFKGLKEANSNALTKIEREHVTPYLKKSRKFKKANFVQVNNKGVKLSIDTLDDYKNIKKIFKYFSPNIYFPVKSIFKKKLHLKILQETTKKDNLLNHKTKNGQILWGKAKNLIAGGTLLLSKNPERYLPNYWPTYFKSAKGCKIIDYDNNKFIDLSLMGVGTNVLGYANSFVDNAVKKIISKSNMSTLNCQEEILLAEKLIDLHPWANMVKLARTGGEANSVAIRIARAASSKDNVAFCGYHGWHDWYLSSNLEEKKKHSKNLDNHLIKGLEVEGVPKVLKKTSFPFFYGDIKSFNKAISNKSIGVVKMEVCRNTEPNISFLQYVRKICSEKKIILIFDECTTGFRQSLGGLHMSLGIYPDMAIFGKALGNGYAITAIIGKKEIMESSQKSFISSTFWTERIGPTAALATIQYMEKNQTWKEIKKIGSNIQKNWIGLAKKNKLNIKINGIPSLTNFIFQYPNHQSYKTLITQEMLLSNILASNSIYPCIDHKEKILRVYYKNLDKVFKLIKKCEDGYDLSKYLRSLSSTKEFKRLN